MGSMLKPFFIVFFSLFTSILSGQITILCKILAKICNYGPIGNQEQPTKISENLETTLNIMKTNQKFRKYCKTNLKIIKLN